MENARKAEVAETGESFYVGRWHSPEGCRIALVKRGRKLVHLCVQDYPVTVASLPLAEERQITPLDYPVQRAARKMLAFAKHGNATQAALAQLKAALA